MKSRLAMVVLALSLMACADKEMTQQAIQGLIERQKPDSLPVLQNTGVLPFVYPPALYDQKVQGNVTLGIYIDESGRVTPESTKVIESSGHKELDSAAVNGSRLLHFTPAKTRGVPQAVAILFPVFFRHPQGGPMPGDSLVHRTAKSAPSKKSP